MRIRLQFFGLVREAAGTDHAFLELPEGSTVGHAVRAAEGAIEGLRSTGPARVRFAINTEYAGDAAVLRDGDTLSFIPPVGGG
jgi:molybdopterin converting factor small subunit